MNLAQELKNDALALEQGHTDAFVKARKQARQTLETIPFPEKRQEAWKYTTLAALSDGHLKKIAPSTSASGVVVPELAQHCIIITNGRLPEALPELPKGLAAQALSSAENTDAGTADPDTFFGWLNITTLEDGLLLRTQTNQIIEQPVHVVFFNQADSPCHASNRLHLELAEGSSLTLIEHYLGNGPILANAVTHIKAGANSKLVHYRLQGEHSDSLHIGNLLIEQQGHSRVESTQLMQGNRLRRNDIHCRLTEPGAELTMRGIFLARGNSHTDNHVTVEHQAPHCQSDQDYRAIANEKGRSVFNGRIHIHPGAQGSNAELANKNLLLSAEAEIDSKPELEIYNDDVKCAHGTTIGQMDPDQLFYLCSRGIDENQAKRMLGTGFVNALLMAMDDEHITEWAANWLGEALA